MKILLLIATTLLSLNSYSYDVNSLRNENHKTPRKYDWIILDSDEVLKGEFISLYQEEVEFDSDELGILNLDWSDISNFKSTRIMSIRLNNGQVYIGRLVIDHNKVKIVRYDDSVKEFDREQLNTVASTSEHEAELWNGKLSFGVDIKDGNSKKLDVLTSVDLRRLSSSSRTKINYLTQFSKASGEQTSNNHKLNSTFDIFYSKKVFLRLADLEFFKDKFQNIKSRTTVGLSLGYTILDSNKHELDIALGPSFQQTKYIDVPITSKDTETSPVLQFSSDYEYEVNKDIDFELSYKAQLVKEESGRFIQNIKSTIEIEVINDFDIEILAILDRVENPVETSTGVVPKKNDITMSFGLGYEF
jgi:putative salt-induced outer membrane protein YdiY